VDKTFSATNPFSKYTASFIAENEKGLWEEFMVSKYTDEESKALKTIFGKNTYDKSQNFRSNLIEPIAFTWTL
jgi:hypothetical protein